VIVFDTETEPFGPCSMAPPLVILTVGDISGAEVVDWRDAEPIAAAMLEDDLVGHYAAYDMAVLGANYPVLLPAIFKAYDEDRVTDTAIRQKLADLAAGSRRINRYGLDVLAKRLLGVELAKGDVRTSFRRDTPLTPEQRMYAELDVVTTACVHAVQAPHPDEFRQARASFWLRLMSCWGLTTDPPAVREFAARVQRDYDALEAELVAAGLMRPSRRTRTGTLIKASRDTKAAMARMVAAGSTAVTETGRVALDDAACRDSGDPLLVKYGEASSLAKRLSTDVPLVRDGSLGGRDGKKGAAPYLIHARFEELLETGRTSSTPNIQNLPRKGGMRECFIPRPGHVYIAADYEQMELRTLAQVCMSWFGRSKLAEVLNAGRDPHLEMAASILGGLEGRTAAEIDDARQVAKVANFGFPGGLGAKRLVFFAKLTYGVEITEARARKLKDQWLRAWPEMRDYFARIDASGDRILQLFSGRWRGGVSYCEACNSPFQGLAADAAKAAGWLVTRAMYIEPESPLWDCRLVNFVHDELIAEAPEERAAAAAEELARLMVLGAAPWLPDVPARAEPVVMRRWYKGAKPVRVAGVLVPSKPGPEKGKWIHDEK